MKLLRPPIWDDTLTNALRRLGYSHQPGRLAGTRNILKGPETVSEGHLWWSSWIWLLDRHPEAFAGMPEHRQKSFAKYRLQGPTLQHSPNGVTCDD